MTCDAPDKNMVSSGGWDERDKYKISSGSYFFSKLVGGNLNFKILFLLSKKDFVTLLKWTWPLWHFIDFWGPVMGDQQIEWNGTVLWTATTTTTITNHRRSGKVVSWVPGIFFIRFFISTKCHHCQLRQWPPSSISSPGKMGIEMTMMIMVISHHLRPRWVFFQTLGIWF